MKMKKNLKTKLKTRMKNKMGKRLNLDEEYIKKGFTEGDKSTIDIAKELNVSNSAILSRLKEMGVDTRHKLTKKGRAIVSESARKQLLENNPDKRPEVIEILRKKALDRYANPEYKEKHKQSCINYYKSNDHWTKDKEKPKSQVEKMSISRSQWYEKYPEKAIMKEEKRINTYKERGWGILEKNANWKGGIMFEPYSLEFNKAFKEKIRVREGFLCLKCGMRQEDSLILFKCKLTIHHINYNKKLTIQENCCSLCRRCNAEVNSNRLHWTKFFQSLLSEIYEYKYSENGEIIVNLENCKEVEEDVRNIS
jgi:hypothetical protein